MQYLPSEHCRLADHENVMARAVTEIECVCVCVCVAVCI